MRILLISIALVAAMAVASVATTIEFVDVGNPGNPADSTGQGSVTYAYRIGRTEVTNSQYADFLNAVAADDTHSLFSDFMESSPRGGITRSGSSGSFTYAVKPNMGNKPVNYVSFHDAMRFANWLHNGQPTGMQNDATTEMGAYTITGNLPGEIRMNQARFFIPTFDEAYKAAYHMNDGVTGNYFDYATTSDAVPTNATADANGDVDNPGSNVANYGSVADWNGQNGNVTTVATAGASSPYLTFDQAGNVNEWIEVPIASGNLRAVFGGSFKNFSSALVAQTASAGTTPGTETDDIGFRIAARMIPEPSSPLVIAIMLLVRPRRRRHSG